MNIRIYNYVTAIFENFGGFFQKFENKIRN